MQSFWILLFALYVIGEANQRQQKALTSLRHGELPSITIHPPESDENRKEQAKIRQTDEITEAKESPGTSQTGDVTLNIYGGGLPAEGGVAAASEEAAKEEMDKIANTIGRLEAEEGEDEKHESDLEDMDARHAESKANAATGKILSRLAEETKEIQQEEKKEDAVLSNEEAEADAAVRALEVEEEEDESNEKATESGLKKKALDIKKDMIKEEELIKEDEDEIKESVIEAEEELSEIARDEAGALKKVREMAGTATEKRQAHAAQPTAVEPSEPQPSRKPSQTFTNPPQNQQPAAVKETSSGNCYPLTETNSVEQCHKKPCAALPVSEGYPPAFRQPSRPRRKSRRNRQMRKKQKHHQTRVHGAEIYHHTRF